MARGGLPIMKKQNKEEEAKEVPDMEVSGRP